MGSNLQNFLIALLAVGGGITAFVLVVMYVAVPVFRGIGTGIGAVFAGIGWFFNHIFEFIGGVLGNALRFIGSLLVLLVLVPLVPLNIVIGRWSAAAHFAQRVKGECKIGATCVYRAVIHHPLKLVMLHGLLEGLEQRVPEAMFDAPGADMPSRRVGQFDGYTIVGSLRAGGSGAKLYIAEPDETKRRKFSGGGGRSLPNRVVIKCFALTEGSSLPQIVRESRALECAKQLGHVLDHGMDQHRFYYVMPYHPGDHLGLIARQMHAECGGRGLDHKHLKFVMSHSSDLLATLSAYHKGGLWHKDVKPENVIVHDGRAHLVDLGLVTPLRSAMTLTTHGTEYFRDPEMVRQALRGVKVHQVDGAKFDIYAVGAVIYFMIENTFPAHGGLSRFVMPSPEALRWIVRRSMTEYNQRYSTADEMLADLEYIARASNAFAIKPADLPSMRGIDSPAMDFTSERPEVVAAAGSTVPRGDVVEGFGIAAGIGTAGRFAQAGRFKVDSEGRPMPLDAKLPPNKPSLTVTNWWTGEYRAESAKAQKVHDEARQFREQAYAFRGEAEQIGRQAKMGVMSARRAAREQIKAARQRAREMRSRASARRHRVVAGAGSGVRGAGWAAAIGVMSLLFLAGILAVTFLANGFSSRVERRMASVTQPTRPVLLVVDANDPSHPQIRDRISRVLEQRRDQGYDVIVEKQVHNGHLSNLIQQWRQDSDGPADQQIENELASRNLYGILYLQFEGTNSNPTRRVVNEIIHSTRPNAATRRRLDTDLVPAPPKSTLAYLLINDHPAKADLQVTAKIEQIMKAYRDKGWNIESNDDAEVAVRRYLPAGPIDSTATFSPMLHATLVQAKFGGVLKIDAKPGDGPAQKRVAVTRIDAVDSPIADESDDRDSSSVADQRDESSANAIAGTLVGSR